MSNPVRPLRGKTVTRLLVTVPWSHVTTLSHCVTIFYLYLKNNNALRHMFLNLGTGIRQGQDRRSALTQG